MEGRRLERDIGAWKKALKRQEDRQKKPSAREMISRNQGSNHSGFEIRSTRELSPEEIATIEDAVNKAYLEDEAKRAGQDFDDDDDSGGAQA